MRSLVAAALVLLTAEAAFAAEPNPESRTEDLPPPGYRHMFPPHAWCREQAEAAAAFCHKCERMLAGDLDADQQYRWERLEEQASRSRELWFTLGRVQDPAGGGDDLERRVLLRDLYDELGPEDFHAGRMPPPIPPDAPID